MAQFVELAATPRDKTGKGAARQIRFQKKVPAVIYGHGREPQPLVVGIHRGVGPAGVAVAAHTIGPELRAAHRPLRARRCNHRP